MAEHPPSSADSHADPRPTGHVVEADPLNVRIQTNFGRAAYEDRLG